MNFNLNNKKTIGELRYLLLIINNYHFTLKIILNNKNKVDLYFVNVLGN